MITIGNEDLVGLIPNLQMFQNNAAWLFADRTIPCARKLAKLGGMSFVCNRALTN